MSSSTLGSSKSLNGKTIGIAVAAGIIVLGIIGWTAGWFGGSDPAEQAAPAATATEQPAVQSTAPAAPAAPAAGTGTNP